MLSDLTSGESGGTTKLRRGGSYEVLLQSLEVACSGSDQNWKSEPAFSL